MEDFENGVVPDIFSAGYDVKLSNYMRYLGKIYETYCFGKKNPETIVESFFDQYFSNNNFVTMRDFLISIGKNITDESIKKIKINNFIKLYYENCENTRLNFFEINNEKISTNSLSPIKWDTLNKFQLNVKLEEGPYKLYKLYKIEKNNESIIAHIERIGKGKLKVKGYIYKCERDKFNYKHNGYIFESPFYFPFDQVEDGVNHNDNEIKMIENDGLIIPHSNNEEEEEIFTFILNENEKNEKKIDIQQTIKKK